MVIGVVEMQILMCNYLIQFLTETFLLFSLTFPSSPGSAWGFEL